MAAPTVTLPRSACARNSVQCQGAREPLPEHLDSSLFPEKPPFFSGGAAALVWGGPGARGRWIASLPFPLCSLPRSLAYGLPLVWLWIHRGIAKNLVQGLCPCNLHLLLGLLLLLGLPLLSLLVSRAWRRLSVLLAASPTFSCSSSVSSPFLGYFSQPSKLVFFHPRIPLHLYQVVHPAHLDTGHQLPNPKSMGQPLSGHLGTVGTAQVDVHLASWVEPCPGNQWLCLAPLDFHLQGGTVGILKNSLNQACQHHGLLPVDAPSDDHALAALP